MLISACAGNKRGHRLLSYGDEVAIVPHTVIENEADARIRNRTLAADANTGLASGAAIGAVWGLTCGPLFWFCSPFGALAGAATGGTAGLLVGAVESLPRDKVAQLEIRLESYLAANNPQLLLESRLVARATNQWQLVAAPAAKEISIQIDELGLHTHRGERVTLVIRANYLLKAQTNELETVQRSGKLDYESAASLAQSWFDDVDLFIAKQFDDAFRALAEELVILVSRN